MTNLLLAVEESELRAGDHVLQTILNSENPQVQRLLEQTMDALPAGSPQALRRFVAHVHGALLASTLADEPAPGHLHDMRDAYDATEARD